MKGVRDCSVFRGGRGADGIYSLPFPKYNDPPAYPILFTQSFSPQTLYIFGMTVYTSSFTFSLTQCDILRQKVVMTPPALLRGNIICTCHWELPSPQSLRSLLVLFTLALNFLLNARRRWRCLVVDIYRAAKRFPLVVPSLKIWE